MNNTNPNPSPRVEYSAGRLEVYFAGKPDTRTRATLKERGFWWDGARGCWWLARPVSVRFVRNEPIVTNGFAYALDGLELCGVSITAEQRAALVKADSDAAHQAGVRGMEIASGIG